MKKFKILSCCPRKEAMSRKTISRYCPFKPASSHFLGPTHRVHSEGQRPLSDVHSIMMVKSVQSNEGMGGARPPPFHTITSKVVMYTLQLREQTLPLFLLYPFICTLSSNCSTSYWRYYMCFLQTLNPDATRKKNDVFLSYLGPGFITFLKITLS
jgi:hypothetical protein